ncbi:molybdopterin-guanine dinucleotide biosynthesis protein B [Undibacterium sp. LX40W]|uniref:Molybdopterin-guanine dinucleotide biosynthesis protein B n=1 Tax=Undibacterium nitidum TaxID=2762298 RepID=A0A923KSI9_9BURK|nr:MULTISPECIES: molybdopterin-guanine dinucleotide biosynthesis protein B [Undibacterium]MBC3880544.1 molybdopterin-guanine dinucleotide biosynthesis protein B [Undibacterium nitidum]MBC3890720.1 molybdopterin-guanine dinucleotide biosynthesis protein B [Undibacterium sp. LX40W]
MKTPCIGIVGWSGSGKTTLLEKLINELGLAGLKVNVIKHSHHDVILEPKHKDTARFRQAGAQEVLLASPYRIALVRELRDQTEPSLDDLLKELAPADVNLIEGYKWAEIPKIEVWRPGLGKPALYPTDLWIKAVASDQTKPSDAREGLIWLDLNQTHAVWQYVMQLIQTLHTQYEKTSPQA